MSQRIKPINVQHVIDNSKLAIMAVGQQVKMYKIRKRWDEADADARAEKG